MGISALIGAGVGEAAAGVGIAEGIGGGLAAGAFEGGGAALGALGGEAVFGGAEALGALGGAETFAGAGFGAAEALGADAALSFAGSGIGEFGGDAAFAGSDLSGSALSSGSFDNFASADLTSASFDQPGAGEFAAAGGDFPQYQGDYPVSGDWSQATINPEDSSSLSDLQSGQFGDQQVATNPQTGDPVTEAMQGGPASEQAAGSGGRAAQAAAAGGRAGGAGAFNPGSLLSSLMQMAAGKPSPPSLAKGNAASQGLLDQGNQLLANYNQGILSAPMMAQLQLSLQGNLNKIRQFYASSGRYNSTDRIQAENLAYTQATAAMAASLDKELTAGLQALGQAGSLFNQQAQIELSADQQYRSALNQALGSILKIPFSGGAQQSGLAGQAPPSEQQIAGQQNFDYGDGGGGGDFPVSMEG